MTRLVVLMSAAALAGCGNVEPNTPDDLDGGVEGFAVEIIPTQFFDERGDHIAFSTGEPVHTHAGSAVTLGGDECPAVYKYSYLLGPVAPPYGKEATPNPIAWKFRVLGGTVSQAEFRVRSANATEIDWTPATESGDGTFGVEIHRSGRNGFPNLEVEPKQYFVDFRVRDDQQREAVQSACWEHHPLGAPVSFSGLVANTDGDALLQQRLAADSRVSPLMLPGPGVKILQARIEQQTAEPVSIHIDIPRPVVAFTENVVVDWFNQGDIVETFACETTCLDGYPSCVPQPATDPRCASFSLPSSPDPTLTGVLGQARWSITVFDGLTMQPASECSATDTSIDCVLAPRMNGAAVKEFVIVMRASELTELDPDPTKNMWEFNYLDLNYTGHHITDYDALVFCMAKRAVAYMPDGSIPHQCEKYRTYRKLVMIDRLRLDVSTPTMTVATGASPSSRVPPHYLVDGKVNGASFVWDSGDDDLPGPH